MNPNCPRSFWDIHPDVRDHAARLDDEGHSYKEIRESIRDRFGDELVPSITHIYRLRKGIQAGRWIVPVQDAQPEPPEEPSEAIELAQNTTKQPQWDANAAGMPLKARTLLGMQCVACRIKGMITLSGKGCLSRQLKVSGRKHGRKWVVSEGKLAMHPGFSACVGCPHWLTDTELAATASIVKDKPPPGSSRDGYRIL